MEGSGVASGFIGLYAISLVKDIMKQYQVPSKILAHVNKELYFKLNIHTLTMVCILIDYEKSVLSYSLGGLPEPILFSNNSINYLATDSLIILGVTPDSNFENYEVPFLSKDLLFIYNNAFFNSRNHELRDNFEGLKEKVLATQKSDSATKFQDSYELIKKYLNNPKNKNSILRDLSFILYEL